MTEWTQVPHPARWDTHEEETAEGYVIGALVYVPARYAVNAGRTGAIVGWAANPDAWDLARHGTGDLEYLADSDGPLVRFDDQDPADETLHWYPGQAQGCLTVLS